MNPLSWQEVSKVLSYGFVAFYASKNVQVPFIKNTKSKNNAGEMLRTDALLHYPVKAKNVLKFWMATSLYRK